MSSLIVLVRIKNDLPTTILCVLQKVKLCDKKRLKVYDKLDALVGHGSFAPHTFKAGTGKLKLMTSIKRKSSSRLRMDLLAYAFGLCIAQVTFERLE